MPDELPAQGTLIQGSSNPLMFYSFGPWESPEDIQRMRQNKEVAKDMAHLVSLCREAKPGTYVEVH